MFKIRTADFKDSVTIVIKGVTDVFARNEDGLPIDATETKIVTRAYVKYLYGKEYESTEQEENRQSIDFYVRNRKSLKDLSFKDVIIFNDKRFNISYVNKWDDILEIRGVFYDTTNNDRY